MVRVAVECMNKPKNMKHSQCLLPKVLLLRLKRQNFEVYRKIDKRYLTSAKHHSKFRRISCVSCGQTSYVYRNI